MTDLSVPRKPEHITPKKRSRFDKRDPLPELIALEGASQ
jgi:hypothetical protein